MPEWPQGAEIRHPAYDFSPKHDYLSSQGRATGNPGPEYGQGRGQNMGKHDKVLRSAIAEGPCGMAARNQIGALCWRPHGSGHEVLLITSRDTGRWIIPKGWLVQGLTAAGSAAREAWEEAGIEGRPEEQALGYFAYRKGLDEGRAIPCVVEVFALKVDRLTDRYPEKGERRRKWFRPEKAAKKVDEPELRQLILSFAPPVEDGRKPAKRAASG